MKNGSSLRTWIRAERARVASERQRMYFNRTRKNMMRTETLWLSYRLAWDLGLEPVRGRPRTRQ